MPDFHRVICHRWYTSRFRQVWYEKSINLSLNWNEWFWGFSGFRLTKIRLLGLRCYPNVWLARQNRAVKISQIFHFRERIFKLPGVSIWQLWPSLTFAGFSIRRKSNKVKVKESQTQAFKDDYGWLHKFILLFAFIFSLFYQMQKSSPKESFL